MNVVQALVLGLVQGLTEFLPISSSAHLAILQHWMKLEGHFLLPFDVFVHLGTLAAIVIYFRKDLLPIPKISWSFLKLIVIATIPTVIIGFALKDHVEGAPLSRIGLTLACNSLMLFSTRWAPKWVGKSMQKVTDAILIGIAQGIAVNPGVSRSGITISSAMWLGIKPEEAAKFSFFIAIPAIIGAAVLVLPDAAQEFDQNLIPAFLTGFIASFISGYLAIAVLFRIISKGAFHFFAAYTLLLSVLTLISSRVF